MRQGSDLPLTQPSDVLDDVTAIRMREFNAAKCPERVGSYGGADMHGPVRKPRILRRWDARK